MSYIDQPAMSPRKITALTIAALFHVLILVALLLGGKEYVKKVAQKLTVIDIAPPPPPPLPPPPPPPPTPKVQTPPPLVVPPTIVQTPPPPLAPQMQAVPVAPPAVITPLAPVAITPPAPPAPAAPPAPSQATGAKPRGNPSNWMSTDDYPAAAMRDGVQGVTRWILQIDGTGRVTGCTVTASAGSSVLDETACRLLPRRARFTPAKDAAGNGIPATYPGSTRWVVPKD